MVVLINSGERFLHKIINVYETLKCSGQEYEENVKSISCISTLIRTQTTITDLNYVGISNLTPNNIRVTDV